MKICQNRKKKVLDTIADALPNMSEFDKGIFLAWVKQWQGIRSVLRAKEVSRMKSRKEPNEVT